MAHNLTIRENGTAEMFSGQNIVPWPQLGTVVPGTLTAAEAIKAAQLDWQVGKLPVFGQFANGETRELEGYHRVARMDNLKTLAIVGDRYHCIQNSQAFDFFDNVVGSGQAVYDTAGSLHGGSKVWIMAKLKGQLFVGNDDAIDKNVLLVTTHDGTGSLSMQIVATRVVCQNTLSAALAGAVNRIRIRHTPNFQGKVNEAQRILGLCRGYFLKFEAFVKGLEAQKVSAKQAQNFVEKLLPLPINDKGEIEESARRERMHAEILEAFRTSPGCRGVTKWDLMNGVTYWVDHKRGTRVVEGADRNEKRFDSAMLGSGAALKQRAVDLLVK